MPSTSIGRCAAGIGLVLCSMAPAIARGQATKEINEQTQFDLGYMLVYQQKASGYEYDLNHTLRWFFYFTPDFRNTKSTHDPAGSEE